MEKAAKKLWLALASLVMLLAVLSCAAWAVDPGELTIVEIGTGTNTTYYGPFNSLWGYSCVQQIYLASEIGEAGTIHSIAFQMQSADSQTNNIKVWLVPVTMSQFTSTNDMVNMTEADCNYAGSFTFHQGWNTIELQKPFEYDGVSNVLVCIHESTPGYSTRYFYYTPTAGRLTSVHSDSANPDPTNLGSFSGSKYVQNYLTNIRFGMEYTSALATGIDLSAETLTSPLGGNPPSLTVTLEPEDAAKQKVVWSVEQAGEYVKLYADEACTQEVGTGKTSTKTVYVKALAEGSATVTVTVPNSDETTEDDLSASCQVTARYVSVAGVELDLSQMTLTANDPEQRLTATISPVRVSDSTVVWSSSDETVATVDSDGRVTAVSVGSATITATATNGTDTAEDDVSASCLVICWVVNLLYQDCESDQGFAGWEFFDRDGDGYNWFLYYCNAPANHDEYSEGYPSQVLTSASWIESGALTPDNWLLTPEIDLSGLSGQTLSFWLDSQDGNYPEDILAVYVGESTDTVTSEYLDTMVQVGGDIPSPVGFTRYALDLQKQLAALGSPDKIRIAFRHYNCVDLFRLNLDNIMLQADGVHTITAQPQDLTLPYRNQEGETLSVAARTIPGFTLTYQWFRNTENSYEGAVAIEGATSPDYRIPDDLPTGVYYYYCAVGANDGGEHTAPEYKTSLTAVTVTPREVQVYGIEADTRVYDGSVNVTLNYDRVGFSYTVGSDTYYVGPDTLTITAVGAFDTADAGENKTVSLTDLVLGGDTVNYVLAPTGQQTATTGTITKREVFVYGIEADTKVYDGNVNATLDYSNVGFTYVVGEDTYLVTPDTLTIEAVGTFDTANAEENKTVTLTDLVLGGDTVNYVLAPAGQQTAATASITKREVFVYGIGADTKVYDGNVTATPNYSNVYFTYTVGSDTYVVGPDTLTITATGTFDTADAGENKTVSLTDLVLGGDTVNYVLAPAGQQATATATVSRRDVTLTSADGSKAYDGAALTNTTVNSQGFVTGQGATYNVTGSQTLPGSSDNEFTYTLNADTNLSNYNVTIVKGTLTINDRTDEGADKKYEITVTANSDTLTYDGQEHTLYGFETLEYTFNNVTYTVSGLSTTYAVGTDVDVYPVTISGTPVVSDPAGNDLTAQFLVNTVDGSLTITPRPVTLTSATDTKEYDGTALTNSNVTVSGDGFVTGEGAAYNVTGSQTLVGSSENEFTYTLNQDTKASNYTITTANGLLTVTNRGAKHQVQIQVNSGEFTYDGQPHQVTGFVSDQWTYTVGGDTLVYTISGYTFNGEATDAGVYAVNAIGTAVVRDSSGADVSDQFAVVPLAGTMTIHPRPVTLTSASDTKEYDGEPLTNSNVTASGDGFAAGEGLSYNITGTRTLPGASENSFTYSVSGDTKLTNYDITTSFGTLTVTGNNVQGVYGTVYDQDGVTPKANVLVTLAQGNQVFGQATTGDDGKYLFQARPGSYNLIAEYGNLTETELVEVKIGPLVQDVVLPAAGKNSVLDNDNADSYAATVGGLDQIADADTSSGPVTITLTVTSDAKSDTLADPAEFQAGKNAIRALPAASGKDLVFLNLQLTKTVGGTQQDIGSTNTQLLTIILPFNTAGKSGITVFRYHGGVAEAMTQNPAVGEEGFVVGSNTITIYAKSFSTYAIGYNVSHSDDDSGSSSGSSSGGGSSETVTICSDLDPKAWYYADTVAALKKGFMEGCEKGLFRPNEDTTRATIVQILWNLAGKPVSDAEIQFSDVSGTDWFAPAVRWAAAKGIIEGWNGEFFPNVLVTREQVAVMLYRYAKTQGQGFQGLWSFQLTHADAEKVSDWAYEALCWLTMKEVIRGRTAATLVPQGTAIRAEIAAIFNRYLSLEK